MLFVNWLKLTNPFFKYNNTIIVTKKHRYQINKFNFMFI